MLKSPVISNRFTPDEAAFFEQNGYIIQRSLIPEDFVKRILDIARRDAGMHYGDIEYEAEIQYPGAPLSLADEGGKTIRRLKQAFSRDPVFAELVKLPNLLNRLQQLLGSQVVMPLAHHNCIMTKHPKYSSDTGWHRDIRYWSFSNDELVNTWVALGDETLSNGCLKLLPGSHRIDVADSQLDEAKFFRTDVEENQPLLASEVTAELAAGDVLFFHARSFHSATRNYTEETKYSAVFTFRQLDNAPLPESRSGRLPELLL